MLAGDTAFRLDHVLTARYSMDTTHIDLVFHNGFKETLYFTSVDDAKKAYRMIADYMEEAVTSYTQLTLSDVISYE